jgi:predicted porin
VYVGIAGSFGNLRLGAPNSIGLDTFSNASPGGTGIGGGYTGGGTAGTMTNSFVQTRYNRSLRFDSPVMSGFSGSLMYIPGNDQVAQTTGVATTSYASGAITPSTVPVAFLIPNARSGSEYGLKYANGPLTVMYTNISQGLQLNQTGYYAGTSNSKAAKTSANFITAQYVMGNTTLYAGMNDGQRLAPIGSAGGTATDLVNSKGNRYAIKQVIGQIDLMATLTTQEALQVTAIAAGTPTSTASAYSTAVLKAKVLGLRGQYNLSKTTAVYAGYEKYSTGADYAASALTTTGDRSIASMGLRKSF